MAFETDLIRSAKEYVGLFITEHFSEAICYHNIDHTLDVVQACEEIGRACGLNDQELELAILAAWFHDTGYYRGNENHESESADIAREFLVKKKLPGDHIRLVEAAILSTKLPQSPRTNIEKVLCDADLYHLSSERFYEKSELLRREINHCKGHIPTKKWMEMTCDFMADHRYHTRFARKNLCPKKQAIRKTLRLRIEQPTR